MSLEHWTIVLDAILGIVLVLLTLEIRVNMTWQTRQCCIKPANKVKSKIASTVRLSFLI